VGGILAAIRALRGNGGRNAAAPKTPFSLTGRLWNLLFERSNTLSSNSLSATLRDGMRTLAGQWFNNDSPKNMASRAPFYSCFDVSAAGDSLSMGRQADD
jgi:hypothetical protein